MSDKQKPWTKLIHTVSFPNNDGLRQLHAFIVKVVLDEMRVSGSNWIEK